MKYPRLKDEDNLAKKLTTEDVTQIQEQYNMLIQTSKLSKTNIRNMLAQQYKVSYATIYYWTNDSYRTEKRKHDNTYWTEMKNKDYDKWHQHKVREIQLRKERMKRNPDLKLWHEVTSAKNEKRVKRKTVKGKTLDSK